MYSGLLVHRAVVQSPTTVRIPALLGGQIITMSSATSNAVGSEVFVTATADMSQFEWLSTAGPAGPAGSNSFIAATDCLGVAHLEPFNWFPLASGGLAIAGTAPEPGHQGVIQITSAGGANSGGMVKTDGYSTGLVTEPGLCFRGIFKLPALTPTVTLRIGFHDSMSSADAVDGAYLEIVNATATFKTSQASTRQPGVPTTLVVSTWYTVEITFLTMTCAQCIIIKDDGTYMMNTNILSSVPSGGTQQFSAGVVGTRSDSVPLTPLIDIDWLSVGRVVI